MSEDDWIRVCPNCGWLAQYYIRQPARWERLPIRGCPKCNFKGPLIEVKASEYGKIVFENRKIE